MPVLTANGETIHYVKEGSGPVVALIHSLGASAEVWRAQIAALKANYTVVAFDCRGHGQSSANGEVSMVAAASDLKALLDHLGVTRCHLVGLSMGGPIALLFNAHWPGVARSLVLADSFVKPAGGNAERVAATKEAIAYISMQEYGTQYAAQRLHPMTSLDVQDELAAEVAKVSPKAYNATMASALLGDFTDALMTVAVPTLVLVGEDDDVTPKSVSTEIAAAIEGAQLTVVANAGHLSNLDNPDAFNAALLEFLSQQPET